MTSHKKFDPAKRKKLNNPERLKWLPPQLLWHKLQRNGGTFVDIGAGTAYLTQALANCSTEQLTIHALDIEPLMIEEMKAGLEEGGVICPQLMELNQLPFNDQSLDGAWMVTLFHELEPAGPLLAEVRRSLRPGARLLVVDWHKRAEDCQHGPPLEHRVSVEEASRQLLAAGFSPVEEMTGLSFHYGLVATAPGP